MITNSVSLLESDAGCPCYLERGMLKDLPAESHLLHAVPACLCLLGDIAFKCMLICAMFMCHNGIGNS
jgi:hypothetical protein